MISIRALTFGMAATLVAPPALFAGPAMTVDTTASAIYFQTNERADLRSGQTLDQIAAIKRELSALLDQAVLDSARSGFLKPEYFRRGIVSVRFKPAVEQELKAKMDNNGVVDLSRPLGIPALDAFNRTWKVADYRRSSELADYLQVSFPPDTNPFVVSDALTRLNEVKWATPSVMSYIGGGTEVVRLARPSRSRNPQAPVYVLAVGWGDCPAGCMAVHRLYFEVRTNHGAVQAVKIGETGPEFPSGMRERYFK